MKPRVLLALVLMPLTVIAVVSTLVWAQCWAFMPEISALMGMFYNACPVASEEARYPADIDILISAQDAPADYLETRVKLSYGGENIVYEPRDKYDIYRLYNVATHQTTDLVLPDTVFRVGEFITEELILVEHNAQTRTTSQRTWALWNIKTGTIVNLDNINTERYLAEGIPSDLQPLILSHPIVYVNGGDLILVPTYLGDPDATATLIQGYRRYPYPQATEEIVANLREMGVEPLNLDSLDSPDHAFRIEPSGYTTALSESPDTWKPETWTYSASIVEAQSGNTVLTGSLDYFEPIGWAAGQRGVVLVKEGCAYYTLVCVAAEPIVLQRQASDHLSPEMQAHFAAQDAQEAAAHQNARLYWVGLIVLSSVLGIATIGTVFYTPRREPTVAPSAAAT